MNLDEARLERYFTARSTTVDIGAGDPAAIAARAAGRRRRRRSAGTGVLALALVAGAIGVQQSGDGGREVTADAAAAGAADPLEWTSVVPKSGLGWSSSSVVGAGSTMFGLSTAPGRHSPDDREASRTTLYRSRDGVEWSALALPDDLYPSRLAMNGDQLYAVGTAPAGGGGRSLVLAAGGTDGAEWSHVDLPLDLATLEARYGDDVSVSGLGLAAGPDGIVASVSINVWADPAMFVPPGTDLDAGATWTDTGLDVYAPTEGCEVSGDGTREACAKRMPTTLPTVARSFTWEELGIDPALRSLIRGELHVFASADGASFDEVRLPEDASGSSTVVATDEGFVLFAQTWPRDGSSGVVTVLRSDDGRTWAVDQSARFTGYLESAGRVGGHAAVVVTAYDPNGFAAATAHTLQADGSWSSLDLTSAIDVPEGLRIGGSLSAVGPMGIATAVSLHDPSDANGTVPEQFLVFSPDGVDVTTVELTDQLAGGYVGTLRVSADAVFAGVSTIKQDPDAEPSMRLLIGTSSGGR